MNRVVLSGRLTKDPEVRWTQANPSTCVARYTLAVDRFKKDEADFITCIAFGKSGEFAEKYLKKGTKVLVAGHIQTGSFQKQDGTKVYTTDVVVDSHEFCESKKSDGEVATKKAPDAADDFMSIPEDLEELPFN